MFWLLEGFSLVKLGVCMVFLVGDLYELEWKELFEVRIWKGEEDEEEWIEIWENMV